MSEKPTHYYDHETKTLEPLGSVDLGDDVRVNLIEPMFGALKELKAYLRN